MAIDWANDPDMQTGSGEFVKFDEPGTVTAGTVTGFGRHTFNPGTPEQKTNIQIFIENSDGDHTVTVGQVNLKKAVKEASPEIGDKIKITYLRMEKIQGGRTVKHFDVQVKRAGSAPTVSAPVAAKAPEPEPEPAPAPAPEPAPEPSDDW